MGLTKQETEALRIIWTGHDTVADIGDFLGLECLDAFKLTAEMENKGLIERLGQGYVDFLKFRVTEKGKAYLPKMNEEEKRLAEEYGLSIEDYKILKTVNELPVSKTDAFTVSDKTGLSTSTIVTCSANLATKGYMKMVGIWRRYSEVTPSGKDLLKKFDKIA